MRREAWACAGPHRAESSALAVVGVVRGGQPSHCEGASGTPRVVVNLGLLEEAQDF